MTAGAPAALAGDMTAAERRWSLAAAIASIAVFGVSVNLAGPLLSLTLDARGVDATVTGLNAASAFLGVILGPLLTARLVGRLGLRRLVLLCLVGDAALFLMLKAFDSLAAWFALRILLGVVGSGIFTATEAWITAIAGDEARGRIIGIYAAALSIGFGVGPFVLWATGFEGWAPFIANAAIAGLAAAPLLCVPDRGHGLEQGGGHPFRVFAKAPLVVLAVGLFGLFEAAAMALLPIWGVRVGLGANAAATTLSAIYFGAIALQVPIGWLSDAVGRVAMLRLCGAAGLLGAALLPLIPGTGPLLFATLFLWGGLAGGLYPLALSMLGDRFRGAELVPANAALVIAYGLGSLVGPALGGAAMDAWNPHGLLAMMAATFAIFLAAAFLPRRAEPGP